MSAFKPRPKAPPSGDPQVLDGSAPVGTFRGFKLRPRDESGSSRISEVAGRIGAAADVGEAGAIGAIVDVPVELVQPNPEDPRVFRPSDYVDSIGASIREHGQQVPCPAFRDGAVYTLIDGHTRLLGIRAFGIPTIRLELRAKPASSRDLYLAASRINRERNNETILDHAVLWREKLRRGVFTDLEDIATSFKISKPNASKILSIGEMPRVAINTLAEYPDLHSLRFLYSLYQYWHECKDEAALLNLITEAVKEGLGSADIEERRRRISVAPRQKPRAERRKFEYGGATGEIARFDSKGKVILTVSGLSREDCEALERKLLDLVSRETAPPAIQS